MATFVAKAVTFVPCRHHETKAGKTCYGMVKGGALFLVAVAVLMAALAHQGRYKIAINESASIEGSVFLVDHKGAGDNLPKLGDMVAFYFDGSRWGFPSDHLWAKVVAGLPGDPIEAKGQEIWVAGKKAAVLSAGAMERASLSVVRETSVPNGTVFVVGENPDSLDSRYKEFGFLSIDQIAGTVWMLF